MQLQNNRKMAIVDYLRQFGPITGSQIQRIFFPSKSEQYRRKMVGDLIKEGFLSKVPLRSLKKIREGIDETPTLADVAASGAVSKESKLPLTMSFASLSNNDWIYFISKKYSFLMHDYEEKTSLKFLGHQIIVSEVFEFLSQYLPASDIQSDSQVLGINGYNRTLLGPIPDLIINSKGKRIAIEVELSQKVSGRYKKKAMRYQYAEFDHVMYFCASDSVAFNMSQQFKDFKSMHYCILTNKKNFFRYGEESVDPLKIFGDLEVLNVS